MIDNKIKKEKKIYKNNEENNNWVEREREKNERKCRGKWDNNDNWRIVFSINKKQIQLTKRKK